MALPYVRFIAFLNQFRSTAAILLATVLGGTLLFYLISPRLFTVIQGDLDQRLVFFTVAEPFLAHLKLALGASLFSLMPLLSYAIWHALARPFQLSKANVFGFTSFSALLFYSGTVFCYLITLPYGIKFLLGFSSAQLQPIISVDKFVTFVAVFILGFGLIFELPIIMVFLAKTGVASRQAFEQGRRYAVLAISITAALLTPTPDVVNMMLMGVPLYTLYELGIIILRVLKL